MKDIYQLSVNGIPSTVELLGFGLAQSSTTVWVVKINGKIELRTKSSQEAIGFIRDLPE